MRAPSSLCRRRRTRRRPSRRCARTSSASNSMGRSIFRKSTTARTRRSSWRRTKGCRLVQSSTSLSTSMPAAFFHRQFLACRRAASPASSRIRFNGNAPFPGNIIPTTRISPIALKLQQYYPGTNLPGLASNFSVPVPDQAVYNQTLDRIDQNIGDKIRIYVRAHYQNWTGVRRHRDSRQREHDSDHHDQLHRRLYPHADAEPGERSSRGPVFLQLVHSQPFLRRPTIRPPARTWGFRASTATRRTTTLAFRTSTSPASTD